MKSTINQLSRHMKISFAFVRDDLDATIGCGLMFAIAGWATSECKSCNGFLCLILYNIVYFYLFGLVHCIKNQLEGKEEDKINKPHRPLAMDLYTSEEATKLLKVGIFLYLLVAAVLGVFQWAFLWSALTQLGNTTFQKKWWTKNLYNALGYYVTLNSSWAISGREMNGHVYLWTVLLPVFLFSTVHIQDLRDIAGDRIEMRSTLPILVGPTMCRYVLCCTFFTVCPIILYTLLYRQGVLMGKIAFVLLIAYVIGLAIRTFNDKSSSKDDHHTYRFYVLFMCFLKLSAITVL